MKMLTRFKIIITLLFCISAVDALSETMIEMPLKNMVRVSDAVIQGKIIQAGSRREGEKGSTIWTDYVIKISDVLHGGKTPEDTVVVTQQGGALDGVVLQVGSNPDLRVGDEVVLFLKKADFLKGMARGDKRTKYTIVGVAQGAYYVVKQKNSEIAFKDYAHATVLPRPGSEPSDSQASPAELLREEVERLREALKRNPEDQNLAKRLREAESVLASAPLKQARVKPKSERKEVKTQRAEHFDMKPPPPSGHTGIGREDNTDLPADVVERQQALTQALEAQAKRFKAIVEPVPLDDLKKRIRAAAEVKD